MTTGQRMKARRKEIGLSAERVAEILGVSPATVYRYENGDIEKVPGDRLEPIAAVLMTTPQALMGWEEFQPPYPSNISDSNPKSTPLSDEAIKIAKVYSQLDSHGQGAVKAILDFEHAAVVAEKSQNTISIRPDISVKKRSDGFIELEVYDQPSAAGLGNYLDDPVSHIEQYPANVIPAGTEFGIKISGTSMSPDIRDGSTVFVQSRISIDPGKVGIFLLNGEALCKKLMVDRYKYQIRLVSFNPEFEDRIIEKYDEFRTMGLVLGSWPK